MWKPAGQSRIIRKRYGVNDFAEWLANDSGKTQNEQKTIIERIVDFINAVIDKISAVLKGSGIKSTAARTALETEEKQAKEIRTAFLSVLENASENYKSGQKNNTDKGDVETKKYALSINAEADIERALNDKNYTEDIKLTDSSPSIIASKKCVNDYPMLMKASHIRENILTSEEAKLKELKVNTHTHYHGLVKGLFLKIIDGLDSIERAYRGTKNAENPIRRENYFLLISQYKDNNGEIVNIPVYINEVGQYNRVFISTNKIATVFGRNNFEDYIRKELKNGNLVKIKNRSNQVSERTAPIAAGYNENTSTDSISNSIENVKNSIDVDSDGNTLSKQQQEYFKDSKVRDENGKLLVVYHGTSEDFTVFDREKGRSNMDIQGSFFSPWELDARGYGANVRAFYLNITNPASEAVGYKALRKFQGQNNAGVKAREYLEKLGYDGVNNGNEEYIAFYSNQIKNVDNLNPTDNDDIRFSLDIDKNYSYNNLISKPDMPVTVIDDKKNYTPNKATREKVIDNALASALSVGHKDESENTFVYVNDIKTNVLISKRGLRHSLDRRLSIIAPVTENIGTILKNSIKVNELTPELDTIEKSYVLVGIAKNYQNEPYVVSFVVNRASNEITSIDVLYAVNAKKEATALIEPELSSQSDVSLTASNISISDLLDYVNNYYPDILSEDVLKHYGYSSRPDGKLGESALYSLDVTLSDYNNLVAENEKLKKANEYLRQEMKLTGHRNADIKACEAKARGLKKQLNSNIDTTVLGKLYIRKNKPCKRLVFLVRPGRVELPIFRIGI